MWISWEIWWRRGHEYPVSASPKAETCRVILLKQDKEDVQSPKKQVLEEVQDMLLEQYNLDEEQDLEEKQDLKDEHDLGEEQNPNKIPYVLLELQVMESEEEQSGSGGFVVFVLGDAGPGEEAS